MDWMMTYNSAKEDIIIAEYGRHVQMMVEYAKTIQDAAYRQRVAERIVGLMMQMTPQNRNVEDYVEKLWRHLFRIAKYELDVKVPAGINIGSKDEQRVKPEPLGYPSQAIRYRHYGRYVQDLIAKAIAEPNPAKKAALSTAIATYMKLAYRTWSRDNYVADEFIKQDLYQISEGRLSLPDNEVLENLVSNISNTNNQKDRRKGSSIREKRGGSRNRRGNRSRNNRR